MVHKHGIHYITCLPDYYTILTIPYYTILYYTMYIHTHRHSIHMTLSLVSLSQSGKTYRARIVGLGWTVGMTPRIVRSALLGATKRSTSKICRKTGGLQLSKPSALPATTRPYSHPSVSSGNTLPPTPEPARLGCCKTMTQFAFLHTALPIFTP
ncbi:hypothetical protein F5Y11DRAFT_110556 [Daldinia sp. FL1419]|nr:hypothetical protein F5Y11DRAFT_110556 [Daldinia sp. FL1419]